MKQTILSLFALIFAASSYAVSIKPITQVNDINKIADNYYNKQVKWTAGDSVRFDVIARDGRNPIDFSGNLFPVLYVAAETNLQELYIAESGSVVDATNGHVRVELQSTNALLDPSKLYSLWMTVYRGDPGTTAEVATVANSALTVLDSPIGSAYLSQISVPYTINLSGITVETDPVFTASVAGAISSTLTGQWSQAYAWGNAATQNLGSGWSKFPATQTVDMAQQYVTNLGGVHLDLTPSGSIAPGRMQWNPDMETVRLGLDAAVSLDVGQQQVAFVRNAESATISNGTVVYISGATGDKATVKVASYSNDTLSARTIGIAAEDIVSGGTGFVVTRGPVYAQKTDTFTQGAMLYLGAYGNVVTNRPQAPLHGVFVGVVEKVNANAGVIYVAVQNGFEIDELHDVNVASVTSGQVLQYNGTVWTNANAAYLPLAGGAMATEAAINMGEGTISNINYIGWFGGSEGYIGFEERRIEGSAWSFAQQPTIPGYLTSNDAAAIYLPLNGGTLTNSLTISRSTTAATMLTLTNSGSIPIGLRADLGGGGTYIDFNQTGTGAGDQYTFSDTIANFHGNKITNAVIDGYLTAALAASTYATGSPLYEVDLTPYATGTPIYSVAGLATGTPVYAEIDPVWLSEKSNYATGTPIYSVSGLATGVPLYAYTETDTIATNALANYLPLAGGTITGNVNASFIAVSNPALGKITLTDSSTKGVLVGSSEGVSTLYFRPADTNESIGIRGGKFVVRNIDNNISFIIAPDGIYDQNGNEIFNPSGRLRQPISETATLGIVTAQTITATSFIGSFIGNGSSITNLTLTGYGLATGTPLYVETDPIWTAASSLYYTAAQVDAAFATGTPLYTFTEADPIWTAASTNYYTSSQADALFATGTPLYSVDLSAYATGSPLYVYTETDSIATNLLTNYYTSSQADALFATGSPLYSVDLTSYLTSTGAAATYLPLAGGTMTGNINMGENQITNVSVVGLFANGNRSIDFEDGSIIGDYGAGGTWTFTQQPTIPGYLTTSTWATADSTTNYTDRITFNATSNGFNSRITAAEGYTNRAASALASSVWATADSTTNYQSRSEFVASSNDINVRLVAVEGYTNRAAAALDSNTWASADSTTNYASRVDYNAFVAGFVSSVSNWAIYPANATVDMGQQNFTNAATISRVTNSINFNAGTLGGSWTFNSQPSIPGYLTTNGSAANLVSFPSSLLSVSAGNTNYLRHTTANPTNATYPGQWNQFTYTYRDATSIIMKVYGPSNKWYGIVLNELPIE